MSRTVEQLKQNIENAKAAGVPLRDIISQLSLENQKTYYNKIKKGRTVEELKQNIENAKVAGVPLSTIIAQLPVENRRTYFDHINTQSKRPRGPNTAKVVSASSIPLIDPKLTKSSQILAALKAASSQGIENVVSSMTPTQQMVIRETLIKLYGQEEAQKKFPAISSTGAPPATVATPPSTVATPPSTGIPTVCDPSESAPPGYCYLNTPMNGDCLFYAVYYAWHPRQSQAEQLDRSAPDQIRQILANEANMDDFPVDNWVYVEDDLRSSVQRASGPALKSLQKHYNRLQTIMNDATKSEGTKINEILAEYKQYVRYRFYWATHREIHILNRYAERNGLPKIWIWTANGEIIDWTPGGVPVHYNGVNHYSILEAIPGKEAERTAFNQAQEADYMVREAEYQQGEQLRQSRVALAAKRQQLTNNVGNELTRMGVPNAKMKLIRMDVGTAYNGLASRNLARNAGKSKAIELGLTQQQQNNLGTFIENRIQQLQGGYRTRKHRKGSKRRYSRKH
jgi:hypothetical protein